MGNLNQSIRLNPTESEAARRLITLCSVDSDSDSDISHHDSQLLAVNTPSFHSKFYKLYPILSFILAVVLLFIARRFHK
jgi:hypothetical protein